MFTQLKEWVLGTERKSHRRLGGETLGITTKLFDVFCYTIIIGSHFSEAATGGDRIHKGTESQHLVKLEYAVPTIRAM